MKPGLYVRYDVPDMNRWAMMAGPYSDREAEMQLEDIQSFEGVSNVELVYYDGTKTKQHLPNQN